MGQEGPSVPRHMVHLNNDMIYDMIYIYTVQVAKYKGEATPINYVM